MTDSREKIWWLLMFLSALLILSASSCKLLKSPPTKYPYAFPPGCYNDDPIPEKTAYLTFDDGPSDWTAAILDILKKDEVKATFFICGDWAPKSDRVNNYFKKYRTKFFG